MDTKKASVNPRLELSKQEMQRLGYQVVDLLVSHFEDLPGKKPVTLASRKEMDDLLLEDIPEDGTSIDEVLEHVVRNVLPNSDFLTHPRFFSFVPSPNNFVSTMADALATGFNIFTGGWIASPAAAEIEIVTINWLLDLFDFPLKDGGGIYTSGGSMANLTALATARKIKLDDQSSNATLYLSDQAHSSVTRAAKVLGFRTDQIRLIPTDELFQMRVDALRQVIAEDEQAGKVPFCVIATSGTTNTGAVDPLPEISDLCQEKDLWLHVDGAYGAAAILTADGRKALRGIERADSLTVDPHKWLFQPYEIGCILVRNHTWLKDTFHQSPEYLRDIQGTSEEINFYDHGVQLTRRFRALKLYMSLKVFGLASFREAIQSGIDLAETTQGDLERRPHWEVVAPATLAVINFRYRSEDNSMTEQALDALNQHISNEIITTREAMLTTTVLKGSVVLRMCLINPRTSIDDVTETLDTLERFAQRYLERRQ